MLNKHLLYLSNDQLCAYRWVRNALVVGPCFNQDAAGVEQFLDYIDQYGHQPVYLLADLIEEDFQRVQVPHVRGRAGARLMQRRLLQQYRETPFRHHEVQGRELDGRRDDVVLLSALTNPSVVQPWVEALEQLQIPLAGLYSTTLLSKQLVRRLGLPDEHLLLVTQQSAGWRQSYFQDGRLKFSRLTPAIDRDGNPVNVGVETAKTQQFLSSVRLMMRGSVLQTVVIAPAELMPALEAQCEDGAETAFRFLELEQVAARLDVQAVQAVQPLLAERVGAAADATLLALLAKTRPPSHYTLGPWQRYFKLWQTRVNLYVGSATLALACALAVCINLWQLQTADAENYRLTAEARRYDQQYSAVMAAMPPRVTSTANMRAAVNVERMLFTQGPWPLQMVTMVSHALEQTPQIRLLQMDWKVNLPGTPATGAPGASSDGEVVPMSSLLAGIPGRPPQALLLEAEVLGSEDDYRNAVDSMNLFARQLAANQRLTVEVAKPPLDTRSSVRLNAKAGAQAAETRARFTLNLVWLP